MIRTKAFTVLFGLAATSVATPAAAQAPAGEPPPPPPAQYGQPEAQPEQSYGQPSQPQQGYGQSQQQPAQQPTDQHGYGAPAGAADATGDVTHQAPGVETHDGFYLRLGLGIGGVSDSVESQGVIEVTGVVSGGAGVGELAFGGTPSAGLVIGGGIYSHSIPEPTSEDVEVAGVNTNLEYEFEASSFAIIAPFIDYYFDPTGGLHLQGAIGLGALASGRGNNTNGVFDAEEHGAAGLGVMVGFGYEWWIADQWGLGILGRFSFANLTGEDDAGVEWTHQIIAPALLMSATLH